MWVGLIALSIVYYISFQLFPVISLVTLLGYALCLYYYETPSNPIYQWDTSHHRNIKHE